MATSSPATASKLPVRNNGHGNTRAMEFRAAKTAVINQKLNIAGKPQMFAGVTVKGTHTNPQVTLDCKNSFSAVKVFLCELYKREHLVGEKKGGDGSSRSTNTTTVSVMKCGQNDSKEYDYTINFYNTTGSILANGPGSVSTFIEHLEQASSSTFPPQQSITDELVGLSPHSTIETTSQPSEAGSIEDEACTSCVGLTIKLDLALQRIQTLEEAMRCMSEKCDSAEMRLATLESKPTNVKPNPDTVVSSPANKPRPTDTPTSKPYVDAARYDATEGDQEWTTPVKAKRTPRRLRHTTQTESWAPERCFMVTEYTDKEAARTLAGVRVAINNHLPSLRVEAVHRPRSGKLIVQLETTEAAHRACNEWKSEILGRSMVRRLEPKKAPITRFLTGVPTYLSTDEVAMAVNELYGISSAHAHRFMWDDKPGTTIKIEIAQSDSDTVDNEDSWVTVGNLQVQLKKPHGTRRTHILQCSACFRFGHGQLRCPHDAICRICSLSTTDHDCDGVAKCVNCKGSHHNTYPRCPKRAQIQEQLGARSSG